ncbi:conserved hypothetical protein [Culex quinquefasciatus]|uniref:Gustatory receptor n=1 Tax=Culex quinquefasciatus TaxID=7176 RepID=B0WPX8_CULQU|nr:conserved hypothetical protein [Culex quinquefasciatus]|eukprot:XP_001850762.1 conserved hypothetical protein [Culex quinquefasciatus]
MIFEVLQLTDQLYTALRIFNGYYGLFMLGVCLVAFIRTSLATYLAMLALLERWDGGRVIFVIVLTVGSYTIFNCGIVYAIFYVCHTTIDETISCTIEVSQFFVLPDETQKDYQTSKFVMVTGCCHLQIILLFMAIHSAFNIRRLALLSTTNDKIHQQIPLHSDQLSRYVTLVTVTCVAVRCCELFLQSNHGILQTFVHLNNLFKDSLFDLYNVHVFVQVWQLRGYFRLLNQKFRAALSARRHLEIVQTLQLSELLHAAVRAFNRYYGLYMLEVTVVAFLRCSLSAYFITVKYREGWFELQLVCQLGLFAVWNSGMIYLIFAICHDTVREANETVLCTRNYHDYNVADNRTTRQINKFLLKNLHQKKKFSAYGFFDIDNSVIYMVYKIKCL